MSKFYIGLFSLLLLNLTVSTICAQSAPQKEEQIESFKPSKAVKEIVVVFKTHFDIGYTHRVNDLVQYYRTDMIDKALKVMDESKSLPVEQQFKWTTPGWVMSKVMEPWPGQTDQRRQKLDEAFRSGKFITHAMPFTVETDLCGPELLTRGLGFASQLTRKYDLPLPKSAKVTDMPSHSRELATVLSNAGVKFLHIGCNWPSGFVQTPGLFWWEGPDGSRLLTFYSSVYGTTTGLRWPNQWGGGEHFVGRGLLPPADWPYPVWPAIFVTVDNSGPPTAKEVKALFDEAVKMMPGVKIKVGTMDDFAAALLATKPQLPVVKGDMPDTWVHGSMCDPGGMSMARQSAPLIATDVLLNTQLKNWGLSGSVVNDSVARAYELMALYAEHTWGGSKSVNQYGEAFKQLPSSTYAELEASWEDKTDYIRGAWKIANSIKQENLSYLAKSVKADPNNIIVYNPLPWQRSGMIKVNGEPVFVKDIPASGYKTIPAPNKRNLQTSVNQYIENQFYKITFDVNNGAISSLIDKRTGRDLATNISGHQMGQYFNERFTYEQAAKYTADYQQGRGEQHERGLKGWLHPGINKPGMISEKDVPYRMASPVGGKLDVSVNGLQQTAILEMPADSARHLPGSRLTVTLTEGQPYIDLEISILNKAKDNWPEADWLALPFNIKNPVFKVYRPLGTMDPATDILKGANKHMYSVGQGVTVTDASGNGIAVCPIDHPLISLDTPGCWKFSLDFVPKKPVVYLNLYNNQWNTNYRYWYSGSWSSRVRMWTVDKNKTQTDNMIVPALETSYPLQTVVSEKSDGSLPQSQKGVELSRKGILVTAFGDDPDGNKGTLLRLWEMAGDSGNTTISLFGQKKFTMARPVNLRGEANGKAIKIVNGKFTWSIHKFGPASFILE